MNSVMLKRYSIIKDVRNLFRLKKEVNDNATKDIRNLLRLTKYRNQRQNN